VQELDKYIRQHENRIQGIKQRQKTADNSIRRKQDSKRKILMGALVEHLMETNKISKTFILDELDNFLIRDSDKALFSDYWSSEDLTLTSKEKFMGNTDNSVRPLSESALQSIASVNLSFSDEVIKSSQASLEATIRRIESGKTSYDQEEERLLKEWQDAKARENSINR
jgi:hypothetical protein